MRLTNRIGAAVLGLVLVAGGLLLAVETAVIATGAPPWPLPVDQWWRGWTRLEVGDRRVLVGALVVAAIGLIVLATQLRRWRPDRLVVAGRGQPVWRLSRRSVQRRLAVAADGVSGVRDARVRVRGRPRRWQLRLRAQADPERTGTVDGAVRAELDRLGAAPDVPVEVCLQPAPGRVA